MQTFAEQLSAVRKERSITQEQLAQDLNVSRTTISRWESGKALPDIETIKRLSQVLNYNFFTVEGLAEDADMQEANAAPAEAAEGSSDENKPASRKRRWWIAALCLVLVCALTLGVVLVQRSAAAEIVCTPSTRDAYLEAFDSASYGWRVTFQLENRSDVDFIPEGLEILYFEGSSVQMQITRSPEELAALLDNGRLTREGGPMTMPVAANLLNLTHVTFRMYGKDEHGHALEVKEQVQFIPEYKPTEVLALPEGMTVEPDRACVVAAANKDVAYLEPFNDVYHGWNVNFIFYNHSETAFQPDGLEILYYENDKVCFRFDIPYEDIQYHMSNGKLYKGGIPLTYPVGSTELYMTHVTCRIFGTDDNGNPVDASKTVWFSQETAPAAE